MTPDDPIWHRGGQPPWPDWLTGFRDTQLQAVDEIVEAYESGAEVVFLDAPTGAGKTLIAEMVRRRLGTNGLYVCSSKSLQDQFVRDFDYARVLKGRANYPTERMPTYTCADCPGVRRCNWCNSAESCPYQMAKAAAKGAPVAVLNTAYLLAETNTKMSAFAGAPFVVVDEADTLESILMGTVEIRYRERTLAAWGLKAPVKGARAKTVRKWLAEEVQPALRGQLKALGGGVEVETIREKRRLTDALSRTAVVVAELDRHMEELEESGEDGSAWGNWVRDYDNQRERDFILKPIRVDRVGQQRVWQHGEKWLCMSATIISAEEQADSLGLTDAGIEWAMVKVPMSFPVENRLILYRPAASLVYREMQEAVPKVADALYGILLDHDGENVLVHTVSYSLTKWLARELRDRGWRKKIWMYAKAEERDSALEGFTRNGGVMLAPSLDRGIDLADDLCRVQVVVKMPYGSLGDRQISQRIRTPGGQLWYTVMTARVLVQMTGRGVRHEEDHAVSYILDQQFERFWGDGRRVMPSWWTEALR